MAEPTGITVIIDLDEYSKFEIEQGRSIITATITVSGGGDMSGEEVTVELIKARRSRDVVVYSSTETLSGSDDPNVFGKILDLNLIVGADQINLIRRGYFFLKVTSVTNTDISGQTSDFPISIVSALMIRETYLFGLKLDASDVRAVKMQPQEITGVEIVEVSASHKIGFDVLNYRYDTTHGIRHISWGKGGPVKVISQPGRYILRRGGCSANEYMIIQVRSVAALPNHNEQEELLVEKDQISDKMLRRWINQSCDWLENDKLAGVFLEPTRIMTDPVTAGVVEDWDFIVPAITFYAVQPATWIDILFPYMSLLKIDDLFGQLATTRIVNVDTSWIEIAERSGFVQLVPFNQEVAFQFIGLVWVESMRGRIELPNFLHFDATAGLRQVDPVLLELIGKKASIDALTVAGHAFRGGFSSQSVSRDGVSESVSYTASAIYGIYSATIEDYTKFINKEVKQVKGRYRGVNLLVA